jgi:hypothetical protein
MGVLLVAVAPTFICGLVLKIVVPFRVAFAMIAAFATAVSQAS